MASQREHPAYGAASVAVLPFDDLSDDVGQAYFARGFVADVIADLSRFRELDVVAAPDGRPVEAPPDVDYLLTGSVRRAGHALRVTAQLVSARSRKVVWAERYDREDARLFEVQDEITTRVVGAVSSGIATNLLAAARRKPVTELAVYDMWLRGMDVLRRGTVEADREARRLFEQALQIDPHYSRGHLGLSLTHFNEWSCQLWEAWDDNETQAFEHAQRANELDDEDHYTHLVLGRVLLFRREFERAESHINRALALNANDPDALVQLAMSLAYLGRRDEARHLYERASRLSPSPPGWYHAYGGIIAFADARYDDVVREFGCAPAGTMVDMPAQRAVGLLETGDAAAARTAVAAFLCDFNEKITPGRSPERGEALRWLAHVNPYRDPSDLERLTGGVRRAGLDGAARPAPPIDLAPNHSAFRQIGSLWQLSYEGVDAHLPHAKGLVDIARLLAQPGQEIHCAELMGVDASAAATPDPVDAQAREAYRRRMAELQEIVDDAEGVGAPHALAAQEELETLGHHVAAAFGLGGRARRPGAPEERARSAVTQRIRASIRKIEQELPALGRHLAVSVRTGTYCSYVPEKPPDWCL